MSCSRAGRRPPRTIRLTIESLAFGGDGVGRAPDGRVVFVPGTAPGDEIEATIDEEKKGFVRASLARIVRPSDARVEPPCPIFRDRDCGGCQWQHVSIEAQRAAKEEIVRRALRHVAVARGIAPIATPSPPLGWRRRARFRWRRVGGELVVGYAARRSHRLVDVPTCPQLEPPLDRALADLRAAHAASLAGSGEIHMLLSPRGDVHTVVTPTSGARQVLGPSEIDLADDGAPFLAAADVFAQVSAPGNVLLRSLVLGGAGDLSGRRVLELHAGSGNFTRDLLAADAVVAVEEHPAAAALAARNLAARKGGDRVSFVQDAAASAVDAFVARGDRFDVVIVDPPRTGLEPGLPDGIRALAPSRIVYVSCDPNTLARDLLSLTAAGGYGVEAVFPTDLMPQTFHIEVVAYLSAKA
jgi:23S rRNA (uracil1939-C5)-methyltransferase